MFLTTRVQIPNEDYEKKLKRILSYLFKEPDLGLTLKGNLIHNLSVYVDASYAVHADFKSHSGVSYQLVVVQSM